MARIVIDPVTRIGGHLRIEAEVESGLVTDAWSTATMFRGLEPALAGRDPRDAWLLAERICGSDNGVHALASVRAVERALGISIPRNARLVRNLLAGSQLVISHVSSFYGRHLPDWMDTRAAIAADPADASALARSISQAPRSSLDDLRAARDRLAALAASGQPGILAPDAGDSAGRPTPVARLTPAAGLLFATHALEALDWRRSMARLQTYFGGKSPHPQTFLLGGMSLTPPWGGPLQAEVGEHPRRPQATAPAPFSERGLIAIRGLLAIARAFVDEVYLPDVRHLAEAYRETASIGRGIGHYIAFGDFPEDDSVEPALLLPRGRIMDHDLSMLDPVDQSGVAETVAHAHYADGGDGSTLRAPLDGRASPRYAGPAAPITSVAGSTRYSWAKAPRYFDDPMEAGPLARMAVAYAAGRSAGQPGALVAGILAGLGLPPDAMFGTLGRTVARAVEASIVAGRLEGWLDDLTANLAAGDLAFADLAAWDPAGWPNEAEGWSIGESPRGAVGHWIRIRDRRIADYAVVDGSTWNVSPRDNRGRRGAIEQALVGTPVADARHPVELLRTVHSFDPCIACATH